MDALGLENFRPWEAPHVELDESEPVLESAVVRLLRESCAALGRRNEAPKYLAKLQAEWLETPQQLRQLSAEGWARLALPVGLEAELQRRLPERKNAAPATPVRSPKQNLRQLLRKHLGESWASQLLSQFGLQRKECVDANTLQSALRSLGVPSFSSAQVAAAVRAAGGRGSGAAPAQDVVAAIHGPLTGARARAVDEVFFDLGGDLHGTLARLSLKRRIAALELPAVKAGVSAEEALRDFTRRWGVQQEVDRVGFSHAHVLLAAMHRGEDASFEDLVRRLWRLQLREDRKDTPEVPAPVRVRGAQDQQGRIDALQQRSQELLSRLRSALRARGVKAVQMLEQRLERGGLGAKELRQALAEVGIGASLEDVALLLRGLDVDRTGRVGLEEWLRALRGPLSPSRAAVVREVFASLRAEDGQVDARRLRERFDASKHPDVEAGLRTAREVHQEVMAHISSQGKITLADFAKYYETVSAGIQEDQYFGHILRRCWGLATSASNVMARNAHRMYEGHIRSTEGGLCGLG